MLSPDIFTFSPTRDATASKFYIGIAIPTGEAGARRFEITVEELGALLSGIDLERATRRKRFRRSAA